MTESRVFFNEKSDGRFSFAAYSRRSRLLSPEPLPSEADVGAVRQLLWRGRNGFAQLAVLENDLPSSFFRATMEFPKIPVGVRAGSDPELMLGP